MSDKVQKIKQEIEERIEQCYRTLSQDLLETERKETNCCLQQYKELLQFIDSLQEEPASEDLEEACDNYYDETWDEHGGKGMVVNDCYDIWFHPMQLMIFSKRVLNGRNSR